MEKQLILWFNKKNLFYGMLTMVFMAVLIVCILHSLKPIISQAKLLAPTFLELIMLTCIKVFLHFGFGLFLTGFIFSLLFIDTNTPVAILDKDGIWVNHYGFIPWIEIDFVLPYYIGSKNTIGGFGIMVKDPTIFLGKADKQGRVGLFWAKLFGYFHITYCHINISSVDVPIENIIYFIQKQIAMLNEKPS